MEMPKTFRELKDEFINAAPADLSDLDGEYLVDMLTIFPSFKRFSHCKIFYTTNNTTQGYNVLFGRKWGHFFVEEDICKDSDQKKVAVINYDKKDNSLFIRGIRDQIRCIEKGSLYLGRFNYMISGKQFFLGYFSLEKTRG